MLNSKYHSFRLARRWKRAVANEQHELAFDLAFVIECNAVYGY